MPSNKDFKIRLSNIDTVKQFVSLTTASNCNVNVMSGRYVIDGKSIMGIFSIDLTRVLDVSISGETEQEVWDLYKNILDLGVIVG